MTTYTVTNRSGGTASIEADHFSVDGGGTSFYDADGNQLAVFTSGEIFSVVPATITFTGGTSNVETSTTDTTTA